MKFLRVFLAVLLVLSLVGCRKINSSASADTTDAVTLSETEAVTLAETETNAETGENASPAADGRVNIRMVGDVLLHERVAESGRMADGSYNYDHLFANCRDEIEAADIAIVNQEVILGGRELGLSGYPSFNGAHEVGDSLVSAGFDVVLHATNHALDKGKNGLLSCVDFWNGTYPEIEVLGIHESAEDAEELCIIEREGIKFAILNYTYGMNGIPLPADMPWCVDMLTSENEAAVRADIAAAQSAADFVIVAPHWGTEYIHTTDASQQYWTDVFFECGVDLVLGTHPHVIEGVELIEDGGHSMLVYYSLGNYVNATAQSGNVRARMLGAIADVTVEMVNGEAQISDYGAVPIVSHIDTSAAGEFSVYLLEDYTEALAAENEIISQDPKFSLDALWGIWNDVVGEES